MENGFGLGLEEGNINVKVEKHQEVIALGEIWRLRIREIGWPMGRRDTERRAILVLVIVQIWGVEGERYTFLAVTVEWVEM